MGHRSVVGGYRGTPHTHDFAEVMWILRGSGIHLVNDSRVPLETGDLVLVRPRDVHTFGGENFSLVNVAFARRTLDFIERRYFADAEWPWRGNALPATYRLDDLQLARLGELSRLLAGARPTRLLLERFLLELLHELVDPAPQDPVPRWLQEALRRLADDREALARGVPALAVLAGRSREHVNRVARAASGRTATELVNEARLTHAATELTMTDDPIARIAVDCGLPNLSHFYRLFNERFGTTPRRFRLRHRVPT